uniref:Uncharacterized protein n=1 Tax=Entomoneis paludosa TaxID=265537 RepID=A0A7S2YDD1_9STRA
MIQQFDREQINVHAALERILLKSKNLADVERVFGYKRDKNPSCSFGDFLLDHFLVFRGWEPLTERWKFQQPSEVENTEDDPQNRRRKRILEDLQSSLWSEQRRLIQESKEYLPLKIMELSKRCDHEHRCRQSNDGDDDSDSTPSEPDEDDCQLASLREQVRLLTQQNDQMKERNQVLQAGSTCARFLAQELERYKTKHRDNLAEAYFNFFTAITGVSAQERLVGPFHPYILVDRILDLCTRFDHETSSYTNPIVMIAVGENGAQDSPLAQAMETNRARQQSFTSNPNAMEVLLKIYSGKLPLSQLVLLMQFMLTQGQSDDEDDLSSGQEPANLQAAKEAAAAAAQLEAEREQRQQELEEKQRVNRMKRKKMLKRL